MHVFKARFGALLSLFAFSCATAPAFADSSSLSIASAISTLTPMLFAIILNPTVLATAAALIVLLIARKSTTRAAQIQKGFVLAYHIVEDLKMQGLLPAGADKTVLAFEKLDSILTTQGITLTDAEKQLAAAVWSAMHGAAPAPTAIAAPKGFARTGLLAAMAVALIMATVASCAFFKSTLVKDLEVDCGEPALAAAAAILLPEVLQWAKGETVDWQAQLAKLEAPGEDAALCAAATGVADFDPNGVTVADAGSPPPMLAAPDAGPAPALAVLVHPSALTSTKWVSQARPTTNLVIAGNLRTYLAGHAKHPVLHRGG